MTQCTSIHRGHIHLSSIIAPENVSSPQPSPSGTHLIALLAPRHRHSTVQLPGITVYHSARKIGQRLKLRPPPWGRGKREPAGLSLPSRQHQRFRISASGEREIQTGSGDANGKSETPLPTVLKSKVEMCETRRLAPELSLPAGVSSLLAELRHVEGRPPSFGSGVLRIEVTLKPYVFCFFLWLQDV